MRTGIVGSGMVGSTAAYAMLMSGTAGEIILIDKFTARAEAEADDLRHATPFAHPKEIRAGDFADLDGAGVVILSAGVGQKPGESRLELLKRNQAIFDEIVPQVVTNAPEAVLLVATNPVDIITHMTAKIASQHGFPASRVIGSGTTLDTARFRSLLGNYLNVDARHVHAYVVGEHGDSEVLTWSTVTVAGTPLSRYCSIQGITLDEHVRSEIDSSVRNAAYSIIEGKGATYYGLGAILSHLVDIIEHKHRSVLTVCTPVDEVEGISDVTVSLPFLVSGSGVVERLPLELSEQEHTALAKSTTVIKKALQSVGYD
jgi:L-lactate dehydrogenase